MELLSGTSVSVLRVLQAIKT